MYEKYELMRNSMMKFKWNDV